MTQPPKPAPVPTGAPSFTPATTNPIRAHLIVSSALIALQHNSQDDDLAGRRLDLISRLLEALNLEIGQLRNDGLIGTVTRLLLQHGKCTGATRNYQLKYLTELADELAIVTHRAGAGRPIWPTPKLMEALSYVWIKLYDDHMTVGIE